MNNPLERYGFRDELGHPLENCVDYIAILEGLQVALQPRCDNRKCGSCDELHEGHWATGKGAQPSTRELEAATAALGESPSHDS
jgi:hypothetical protein